jgi:hypothetical protein
MTTKRFGGRGREAETIGVGRRLEDESRGIERGLADYERGLSREVADYEQDHFSAEEEKPREIRHSDLSTN